MLSSIKIGVKEILGLLLCLISYAFVRNCVVLYFHAPSLLVFKTIVRAYSFLGYKFVDIDEFNEYVRDGVFPRRRVLVTFDDGRRMNLKLMPFIKSQEIPVCIFINSDAVEGGVYWWQFFNHDDARKLIPISDIGIFKSLDFRTFKSYLEVLQTNLNCNDRTSLTIAEIRHLISSGLVTIGNHTHFHYCLSKCPADIQYDEIAVCHNFLKQKFSIDSKYFAYPNGDYSRDTIKILKELNYSLAFTTIQAFCTEPIDRYLIPRLSINDKGYCFENLARALGAWRLADLVIKIKC